MREYNGSKEEEKDYKGEENKIEEKEGKKDKRRGKRGKQEGKKEGGNFIILCNLFRGLLPPFPPWFLRSCNICMGK